MIKDAFYETIKVIGLIIYYYLEAFVKLLLPTPKKDVTDKLVLITGAGNGLGRKLAIKFAELNAQLALLDINKENLIETKQFLEENYSSVNVKIYICDVSNEEEVTQTFDRISKEFGKSVEILINNAGIVNCVPFEELNSKSIIKTFEVNVLSQFWTIKNVITSMKQKNSGHIVSISSIAGHIGNANLTDYCSSKFAIIGLMDSLREELRQKKFTGIKLTTVNPVAMNTGMFKYPTTRFNFLIPVIDVKTVAEHTIDAILKDRISFSVPEIALWFHRISFFVPTKVTNLVLDILDYNVKPHKTKT